MGLYFGLLDDILKVAYGSKTCFPEFQMTFWLALPSWFRKLSNLQQEAVTNDDNLEWNFRYYASLNISSSPVSRKKFTSLLGCEIKGTRPKLKTEILICQSKANLGEKIFFDIITHHLGPEVAKGMFGNEKSAF